MRIPLTVMVVALLASGADAQLVGGQIGGAVGGATGAVGSSVQGGIQVDPALPDATGAVDRTVGDATRAAGRSARAADRAARRGKAVRVDAGASIRVRRGTRCYYNDYYYDPVYREGYYYCERSGTQVDAGVQTGG